MVVTEYTSLGEFLSDFPDWKERIQEPPFSIKVTEKDNLIMLKYNQIHSDMKYRISRECRGIILYADDLTVACRPFDKFFNYKESLAASIDWNTAVALEKADGSLIKLWFNHRTGKWCLSTNGSIDAFSTPVPMPMDGINTFGDMVHDVMTLPDELRVDGKVDSGKFIQRKGLTYLFEIVGPQNRVVVPYSEIALYYLGAIENLIEHSQIVYLPIDASMRLEKALNSHDRFRSPKMMPLTYFNGMEDLFDSVSSLPYNYEGYVVSDFFGNMVKMKSEGYLSVHRLKGEDYPSDRRILESIMQGTDDDFLGFFPEYKSAFDIIRKKYSWYFNGVLDDIRRFCYYWNTEDDRKTYAVEFAKGCVLPSLMFDLYTNHRRSDMNELRDYAESYLKERTTQKLLADINSYWRTARTLELNFE